MINSTPMNIDAAPAVLGPNADDVAAAAAKSKKDIIAKSSDTAPNVVETGENGASSKAKTGLDLYMSQQLNLAGGRKISGHDNKGAHFMNGPYKGMELGPAMEKIRNQYNNNDKLRGQFDAEADRQNKANNLGGLDQAAATEPATPETPATPTPAPGLADPGSSTAPEGVDPFAPAPATPETPATPTPAAPAPATPTPEASAGGLDAAAAINSGGTMIKNGVTTKVMPTLRNPAATTPTKTPTTGASATSLGGLDAGAAIDVAPTATAATSKKPKTDLKRMKNPYA